MSRVKAQGQIAAAVRRARSMPLSRWLARPAGTFLPSETEFSATADHVAYEEREPRITPTGVLDHRGRMLVRVTVPIKEELGFVKPRQIEREADEVETIIAEDLLAVSDCGLGVGYVTPEEVEEETDPALIERLIRAALEKFAGDAAAAKAFLAEQGVEVDFEVRPPS